ncbi:hypothetical protein [Salibacterium lacus]|uniref:Uncharacterized protein n=1 Tax=Salibacterium lacus TaxID=1898109 RepID=A0ABW5SZH9_9BACI
MSFFSFKEKEAETNENQAEVMQRIDGLTESVGKLRSHMEAQESRINHETRKGLRELREEFMTELQSFREEVNPGNVAEAVESTEKRDRINREFDVIRTEMERAISKHLAPGVSLYRQNSTGKHPAFTRNGTALYESISRLVTNLADVSGTTKEKYTNTTQYRRFFAKEGRRKPNKTIVKYSEDDNRAVNTMYATIILHGYERKFIEYLFEWLENERQRKLSEIK